MAISYFNHRLNVGDPGVTVTTRYDAFIDDAEDIAQEVQGTYAQVAASIARAQRRGDLPPNKPVPITDIASFRRRYDIKTGSVGTSLVENTTKEVWDFAADQMLRNDYPSLADYLVDLLVDEYYKKKVN